jgi:lipid-A-disaccharide synthase
MAVPTLSPAEARTRFGMIGGKRTVGLFPGSRTREIHALLPVMLEAATELHQRFDDLQFILPLAPGLDRSLVDDYLSESGVPVTVVAGMRYDVMQVCDLAIAASGTVTMEIALFGVPMIIIYKVAPLSYLIGRMLVQVEHAGICNIVAGERIVPELIQHEANSSNIVAEAASMLTDPDRYARIRSRLLDVRTLLGEPGAPQRVARLALDIIQGRDR